jgi:hypothetical protein
MKQQRASSRVVLALTGGRAVHVAGVLEELRGAPEGPDAGALLKLKGHFHHLV